MFTERNHYVKQFGDVDVNFEVTVDMKIMRYFIHARKLNALVKTAFFTYIVYKLRYV